MAEMSRPRPGVRKTTRVDVRLAPAAKEILERASALESRSLSDFIVSSAMEAAKETIAQHERMSLSARDREAFVQALLDPPAPTVWARAAAKRFRERTGT